MSRRQDTGRDRSGEGSATGLPSADRRCRLCGAAFPGPRSSLASYGHQLYCVRCQAVKREARRIANRNACRLRKRRTRAGGRPLRRWVRRSSATAAARMTYRVIGDYVYGQFGGALNTDKEHGQE